MSAWWWLPIGLGATAGLYGAFVVALARGGRQAEARAAARFLPDAVVLLQRLLRDPRLPRRRKLLLAAAVPYLAMPFDLVPDFIPVAGQLDDVVIVALALRIALRGNSELVEEHWPGPPESLGLMLRLIGGPAGK